MTPSEIITEDSKQSGDDADIVLRKIHKLLEGKAGVLVQKNNSVMLLIGIAKAVAEIHFFIADDSTKLKNSMAQFAKELKNSELKAVYGSVEKNQNPILKDALEFLAKTELNIKKSNVPRYAWMAQLKGNI